MEILNILFVQRVYQRTKIIRMPHKIKAYLPCLFGIFDKPIKAIIYNLEVIVELTLPRNYPSCKREIPVRNVEG